MKVLRTDNFPTDRPDECFVEGLPVFANTSEGEAKAKSIADDYKLNQKL